MSNLIKIICDKIDFIFDRYSYLTKSARIFYSFATIFIATVAGLLLKEIPINTLFTGFISLIILILSFTIVEFLLLSIIRNMSTAKILVLLFWIVNSLMFIIFLILMFTGYLHIP